MSRKRSRKQNGVSRISLNILRMKLSDVFCFGCRDCKVIFIFNRHVNAIGVLYPIWRIAYLYSIGLQSFPAPKIKISCFQVSCHIQTHTEHTHYTPYHDYLWLSRPEGQESLRLLAIYDSLALLFTRFSDFNHSTSNLWTHPGVQAIVTKGVI